MTATTLSDIKGIPALNNYRVIIADDHLMVREGLKWKLSKMNRYSVIAEAENGHDALNHALSLQCDLLLIDISMPGLTGLEVMKKVKLKKPDLRVILLSMHRDEKYIYEAIEGEADGYILKDDDENVFISVINNVMKGFPNFSPRVQSYLLKKNSGAGPSPRNILTRHELGIFRMIVKGYSNKEIAEKNNIAVRTVAFHKQNIKEKLNAKTNAELINIAGKYNID